MQPTRSVLVALRVRSRMLDPLQGVRRINSVDFAVDLLWIFLHKNYAVDPQHVNIPLNGH